LKVDLRESGNLSSHGLSRPVVAFFNATKSFTGHGASKGAMHPKGLNHSPKVEAAFRPFSNAGKAFPFSLTSPLLSCRSA
jgi:hypothetical protein